MEGGLRSAATTTHQPKEDRGRRTSGFGWIACISPTAFVQRNRAILQRNRVSVPCPLSDGGLSSLRSSTHPTNRYFTFRLVKYRSRFIWCLCSVACSVFCCFWR